MAVQVHQRPVLRHAGPLRKSRTALRFQGQPVVQVIVARGVRLAFACAVAAAERAEMVLGRRGDAVALVALEDGEVDDVLGVGHGLQEVVLVLAVGL